MNKKVIVVSSVAALLLGSGFVFAHEKAVDGDIAIEGAAADGFVNASGNAVITGLGECLQVGGYSEDNTNLGCEGKDAEPEEEPVAEAEPAPEPEPAPPKEIVSIATLGGKALFDTDSDTLNGEGEQALADLLVQLERFQEITVMYVTGHTDSRGSESYNQDLSERRAATVSAYLEAAYPDVEITSQGLGETVPRETNSTPEGRQANRRVEVQVTAKSVTQN